MHFPLATSTSQKGHRRRTSCLLKTSYLQIDRSHALLERKRDGEIKKSTTLSLLDLVSLLRMSDPSRRRPASSCDHVRPARNVQQRRWSMSLTHRHVKRKARRPVGRRWNNHQTTTTGGLRRSTSAAGHIAAKTSKEQARLSCTVPACMFSYSPFPCIGRQQLYISC